MNVTQTVAECRAERWADPAHSWGLVPTMGALHEGHASLVRRARADNERVAVSIFVNPTQFGDPADLEHYPRNLEADLAFLAELGVDLVFAPTVAEMYPAGFQTTVSVGELAKPLEGAARPGHFAGVATVVCKLCNIIQPDRVYFGQKDAQQTLVVRRMARDLNLNLGVVICPTLREVDGLARSSRNLRLNTAERAAATVLFHALTAAQDLIEHGVRAAETVRSAMLSVIAAEPLAHVDYVSVAGAANLAEMEFISGEVLISLAVFVGPVRLIDNFLLTVDT